MPPDSSVPCRNRHRTKQSHAPFFGQRGHRRGGIELRGTEKTLPKTLPTQRGKNFARHQAVKRMKQTQNRHKNLWSNCP